MKNFIGRKYELQQLQQLQQLDKFKRAKIVVVKGRRRTGKSTLIAQFAANKHFIHFTGTPPLKGIDPQKQRDEFARQLSAQFNTNNGNTSFSDWTDALYALTKFIPENEPCIILFDEISWLGHKDPLFIPKIKNWWDLMISNKSNVTLFFCGSISTWIEENIIKSTAFFGRITLVIELLPLKLQECVLFLKSQGFKGGTHDIFKLLSVLGGIPWYLEQVLPNELADQTIKRLCFSKNGLLTNEFELIFHDLFNGEGNTYKKILHILSNGMRTLAEIRTELEFSHSGTLSNMLEHLIVCGFITQHAQWSIKTKTLRKQSLYRLSDTYIRFYLKYIEPNKSLIQNDHYKNLDLFEIGNFDTLFSFQVESLLLKNRDLLLKAIDVKPSLCVFDNPWFQTTTSRHNGCQIDYLVQTKTNNLFICEFKFLRDELGSGIEKEVAKKIEALVVPHNFSVLPVLFHLGGVQESVQEDHFFFKIVNISRFLDLELDL